MRVGGSVRFFVVCKSQYLPAWSIVVGGSIVQEEEEEGCMFLFIYFCMFGCVCASACVRACVFACLRSPPYVLCVCMCMCVGGVREGGVTGCVGERGSKKGRE